MLHFAIEYKLNCGYGINESECISGSKASFYLSFTFYFRFSVVSGAAVARRQCCVDALIFALFHDALLLVGQLTDIVEAVTSRHIPPHFSPSLSYCEIYRQRFWATLDIVFPTLSIFSLKQLKSYSVNVTLDTTSSNPAFSILDQNMQLYAAFCCCFLPLKTHLFSLAINTIWDVECTIFFLLLFCLHVYLFNVLF